MINLIKHLSLLLIFHSFLQSQSIQGRILVEPDWLDEHISDPSLVILHTAAIRADYNREHIPGARFLWNGWIAESTPELSSELPKIEHLDTLIEGLGISNNSLVVICHCLGDAIAAARAYITLEYLGLGNQTMVLNGGLENWKAKGKTVTQEIPVFRRGSFNPVVNDKVFVNIEDVIAATNSKNIKIVDGRSQLGYNSGGTGVFRAGHIEGAVNIPYTFVLDSLGKYVSADSIRTLFRQAEIGPDDVVISSCYMGRAAAPVYIASKLIGHTVHIYDGSFEEWSRRTDLPVEKR